MTDSTMPIPATTISATDAIAPEKRTGRNGKAPVSEAEWVAKIKTAWRKSLEAIFEVGDLLAKAKKEIGHGGWDQMCKTKLPFKIDTARRLMDIAADQWLRKAAHGPFLPRSWRTLFELTKWDDECLTVALDRGLIHSEMTRADAENLWTLPSTPPPILDMLSTTTWRYSQTVFLEFIEWLVPTVPKIILFRPTGPRGKLQIWCVEISECPETRTVTIKTDEYCVIRMPLKATANWPETEQRRCVNCGRIAAANVACDCGVQRAQRAAEAIRIIKSVVAFDKYRESDLVKNPAFVFSSYAAQLVAKKGFDGNAGDKREALRLLRLAIKEIEAHVN